MLEDERNREHLDNMSLCVTRTPSHMYLGHLSLQSLPLTLQSLRTDLTNVTWNIKERSLIATAHRGRRPRPAASYVEWSPTRQYGMLQLSRQSRILSSLRTLIHGWQPARRCRRELCHEFVHVFRARGHGQFRILCGSVVSPALRLHLPMSCGREARVTVM
jgi:hypothetical protein